MKRAPLNILIADDDPYIRALLNLLVSTLEAQVVAEAENGKQAIELAKKHQPDLILLDFMMPVMDGKEACKLLKSDPKTRDIPVLFITAANASNEATCLELGAQDFISKPITPEATLARLASQFQLIQSRRELQIQNFLLSDEKELMEIIVERMRHAAAFDKQQLRWIQYGLEQSAGDSIMSARCPDGTRHILVADFSGHGLPAAFGGILAPYIFYQLSAEGESLANILTEINRVLYQQLPTQLYMAAAAVEVKQQQFKVWNYGLPPLLLMAPKTECQQLPSSDIPLGIMDSVATEPHYQLTLNTKQQLFLYSDGITEASAANGEQFGLTRLQATLQQIQQDLLPLEHLWLQLDQHCQQQGLSDDAVLVEISC